MWASADPGPTTKLTQVLQNSASWMVVLRFTTLSAATQREIAIDEIQEKKI